MATPALHPEGLPNFHHLHGRYLFVQEGLAEPALLEGAARRLRRDPKARRAMELAASFLRGRPKATLAEVGAELSRMGVPPRGGGAWGPSSVKALLDRARSAGLLGEEHGQRRHRKMQPAVYWE